VLKAIDDETKPGNSLHNLSMHWNSGY